MSGIYGRELRQGWLLPRNRSRRVRIPVGQPIVKHQCWLIGAANSPTITLWRPLESASYGPECVFCNEFEPRMDSAQFHDFLIMRDIRRVAELLGNLSGKM